MHALKSISDSLHQKVPCYARVEATSFSTPLDSCPSSPNPSVFVASSHDKANVDNAIVLATSEVKNKGTILPSYVDSSTEDLGQLSDDAWEQLYYESKSKKKTEVPRPTIGRGGVGEWLGLQQRTPPQRRGTPRALQPRLPREKSSLSEETYCVSSSSSMIASRRKSHVSLGSFDTAEKDRASSPLFCSKGVVRTHSRTASQVEDQERRTPYLTSKVNRPSLTLVELSVQRMGLNGCPSDLTRAPPPECSATLDSLMQKYASVVEEEHLADAGVQLASETAPWAMKAVELEELAKAPQTPATEQAHPQVALHLSEEKSGFGHANSCAPCSVVRSRQPQSSACTETGADQAWDDMANGVPTSLSRQPAPSVGPTCSAAANTATTSTTTTSVTYTKKNVSLMKVDCHWSPTLALSLLLDMISCRSEEADEAEVADTPRGGRNTLSLQNLHAHKQQVGELAPEDKVERFRCKRDCTGPISGHRRRLLGSTVTRRPPADSLKDVLHDCTLLGVHDVLDAISETHPSIIFEAQEHIVEHGLPSLNLVQSGETPLQVLPEGSSAATVLSEEEDLLLHRSGAVSSRGGALSIRGGVECMGPQQAVTLAAAITDISLNLDRLTDASFRSPTSPYASPSARFPPSRHGSTVGLSADAASSSSGYASIFEATGAMMNRTMETASPTSATAHGSDAASQLAISTGCQSCLAMDPLEQKVCGGIDAVGEEVRWSISATTTPTTVGPSSPPRVSWETQLSNSRVGSEGRALQSSPSTAAPARCLRRQNWQGISTPCAAEEGSKSFHQRSSDSTCNSSPLVHPTPPRTVQNLSIRNGLLIVVDTTDPNAVAVTTITCEAFSDDDFSSVSDLRKWAASVAKDEEASPCSRTEVVT